MEQLQDSLLLGMREQRATLIFQGLCGLKAENVGRKHKLINPVGREDFFHVNIRRQWEWSWMEHKH